MSKTMKSEKQALVPRLRFPEFRGATAWDERRIGQYLTESKIQGSKGDVAKKLTVKLWGRGVYEKQEVFGGSENTQYYRRKSGQFIYSKLDFLNRAFGMIPDHLDRYESTLDLPCFDVSDDLVARFLLEYVQRKVFYEKLGEIADGGRKAKRIQVGTFLKFPIYIPDTEEQQKIADCLSSLDALITAQADKLDALKAHKKGLIQRLFPRKGETVPELRFPEFRNAGGWSQGKISQFLTESKVKGHKGNVARKLTVKLWGKGVFEKQETFEGSENTQYYQRESGQFIYSKLDFLNGAFGIVPEHLNHFESTVDLPCFDVSDGLDARFLLEYVQRKSFYKKLGEIADGGRKARRIQVETFLDFPIYVPSKKEQQQIADCLSSLDALITAQAKKIDALKLHKKGLMQQLFPAVTEAAV